MTHILMTSALALALLSPAGHADELRVAAWNLEHLKDSDLEGCVARREADYAAIAHQVEAFGVDVVAFQEVENEAAARRVFPLSEWNVEVSTRPIADSERTCWERPEALLGRLATGFAVRRGIAYRRNRDLSALAGGDPSLRWGSDITVTRDDRELRLLSVHLKSGCWGMEQDEDEVRDETCGVLYDQLGVLKDWGDARRGEAEDFIILGDFNRRLAIPDDRGWAALSPSDTPLRLLSLGRISRCDSRFVEYIDHLVLGGGAVQALVPDSFREIPRHGPHPDHCAVMADFDLGDRSIAKSESIPLVMAADNPVQQGFVRLINRSERAGKVRIHAIDDSGQRLGPVSVELDAEATLSFNSQDLEDGNANKGLFRGVGDGEGNWRLELDTELDVEPFSYVRTTDGFVTSIHEVAAEADDGGIRYRVPFFNPASNRSQQSLLRLINPGEDDATIVIRARDDRGEASPEGEIRLSLPAAAARVFTAQQLEPGSEGFSGSLGDGVGKWQLFVSADRPIQVMSLLRSPTGNLSNLSR